MQATGMLGGMLGKSFAEDIAFEQATSSNGFNLHRVDGSLKLQFFADLSENIETVTTYSILSPI